MVGPSMLLGPVPSPARHCLSPHCRCWHCKSNCCPLRQTLGLRGPMLQRAPTTQHV